MRGVAVAEGRTGGGARGTARGGEGGGAEAGGGWGACLVGAGGDGWVGGGDGGAGVEFVEDGDADAEGGVLGSGDVVFWLAGVGGCGVEVVVVVGDAVEDAVDLGAAFGAAVLVGVGVGVGAVVFAVAVECGAGDAGVFGGVLGFHGGASLRVSRGLCVRWVTCRLL